MWIVDFPKLLLLHFSVDSECHNTVLRAISIILSVRWGGVYFTVDTPNLNHVVSSYILIGLCKHKRHIIVVIIIINYQVTGLNDRFRKNRVIITVRYEMSYWNKIRELLCIPLLSPYSRYTRLLCGVRYYTRCTWNRVHNAQYRIYIYKHYCIIIIIYVRCTPDIYFRLDLEPQQCALVLNYKAL